MSMLYGIVALEANWKWGKGDGLDFIRNFDNQKRGDNVYGYVYSCKKSPHPGSDDFENYCKY